jgi:predicted DNA repair protein MutK
MASGLFALLDDVAVIAKLAAASADDVAAASARATTKAAGVVIDDAAVTPRYVTGFTPERELPIIWRIAKGSLRNKLLILMPGFLLLAAFLPQALTPLLMLGGAFLCFEAAEKLAEKLGFHANHAEATVEALTIREHETRMVAGAVRTDLILSAEILAIALGELGRYPLAMKAAALGVVSVAVTAGVYGFVALLVKMDDVGLKLVERGGAPAATGRLLVAAMPGVLSFLSALGIAAMAWVGGGIVVHGLEKAGPLAVIAHLVHDWSHAAGLAAPAAGAVVEWIAAAVLSGIFGLVLGAVLAVAVTVVRKARVPAHA